MVCARLLVLVRGLPCSGAFRAFCCLTALGGLAACSGNAPLPDQTVEATHYLQHARRDYSPPGPADDPWGPYIAESSQRYDVPERWIREVMRVESGGRELLNGDLITSPVGAMGLMQVMPSTFDEVSARHDGIGDDPYDPRNNILAGTAYIREMYDVYGSPGFLAAYNAGPRRLDDYLAGSKTLPDETRHYVAMIGPYITDSYPQHRSEADLMALNQIPIDIPPGTRFGGGVATRYAQAPAPRTATRTVLARNESRSQHARAHEHGPARGRPTVELAASRMTAPRGNLPTPPVEVAEYAPPRQHPGSFRIVPAASAEPIPAHHGGSAAGRWAVQVGAFGSAGTAHAAAGEARGHTGAGATRVSEVHDGHATLYRARVTGLSRDAAVGACQHTTHHGSCVVVSPKS